MSRSGRDLFKLGAIIAGSFGVGVAFASSLDLPRAGVAVEPQDRPRAAALPATQAPAVRGPVATVPSFADLVDRVNPSVVYIRTGASARRQPQMRGVPPEFERFFRFEPQERFREGSGSGFIVSEDGYILTNNHVVADADTITVKLFDNREFGARLVGRDPNTDVAVIKINARSLPSATLGNSEAARIGDWVLAIGNPLGLNFTVTSGIISAKGRALTGLRDPEQRYTIQDFIQTDAAINPGNSGGPLINLSGEVIGVNSAIASPTGTYAGYGFAIPINLARHVMNELIRSGRVTRAILGISIGEITQNDADYVGLREVRGVVVNEFSSRNSPARAAGIQAGDVIVALNDTTIDHVGQLQQMVGFRRPGDVVRVTVVRRENGRTGVRRTFDVRLIEAEADDQIARADGGAERAPEAAGYDNRLGLRIEPLTPEMVRRARLAEDQRGVLVADVEEGGPSWRRVFESQIVLAVNDERVRSPEDFRRALRDVAKGQVVQLRVLDLQSGQTRIVRIRTRS
jgi:serine protease Do